MGRELRTKIPQLITKSTATEQDCQSLMREREDIRKLKSKENVDKARRAEVSGIGEGDIILLQNKLLKNKLATNYEEKRYQIIEKHGNAAVIENEDGIKMKNTNQTKRLLQTENEGIKHKEKMGMIYSKVNKNQT